MTALLDLAPATIPPEDEALRPAVRAFLDEALRDLPLAMRARSWMACDADFSRALGQRGWLGLTLPPEYGGGGRSGFARYVVVEELLAAGAPVGLHWIADRQSAPLILRFGTEAQRRRFLPAICTGESWFCIGMSEPGSGSDLASVRTRAVRQPDGSWRVTGQKVWTTNAHRVQHMIALVRTGTDAGAARHAGLSQFIIDLSLPGITIRPITDLTGGAHFNEVFFDDVRLEPDAIVGEEGQGWAQVTAELAFERSGPERLYSSLALFDAWLALVRQDGVASQAAERLAGKVIAQLAPLRALSLSLTGLLVAGESPVVAAALVKDLGTTVEQWIPTLVADDLAARDPASLPPDLLAALDVLLLTAPTFSLRGGTREILRGMIARGLGLR